MVGVVARSMPDVYEEDSSWENTFKMTASFLLCKCRSNGVVPDVATNNEDAVEAAMINEDAVVAAMNNEYSFDLVEE